MRRLPAVTLTLLLALIAAACAGPEPSSDAGGDTPSGQTTDAADAESPDTEPPDTGSPDTGSPDTASPDTESPDTGSPDTASPDAGPSDTGTSDTEEEDSGPSDTVSPDTGGPDAGVLDAGVLDAGEPDTGLLDAGAPDIGVQDAGTPDTHMPDTGILDTGTPDTGTPDTGAPDTGSPDTADAGDPTVCPFGHTPQSLACYSLGVCAGQVVVSCANGRPFCDYSTVIDYEAKEISCDGFDNDCNGQTDDNLARPPAKSWPAKGVCLKALMVCGGGGGWEEPKGWQIPGWQAQELSCDGLDNDCDGVTDADIVAKPPLSTGKGVCDGLEMSCKSGVWTAPSPSVAPEWEGVEVTCDGFDNDCDGQTDEGLIPPVPPPKGVTVLTTGVCTGAKVVCVGGQWVAPDYGAHAASLPGSPVYEPNELSCDGLDNDCDGLTDEGGTGPLAGNQKGVCAGARKVCSGALGWQEPTYSTLPGWGSEKTCDQLDNDCDGLTDEDTTCPVWQHGGAVGRGLALSVGAAGAPAGRVAWSHGAVIVVADAGSGARLWQDFSHRRPVQDLAISADGVWLASVAEDAVLRVRPLAAPGLSAGIDAKGKVWTAVDFAPKGDRLAIGDSVGWLRLVQLDVASGAPSGGLAKKIHGTVVQRVRWLKTGPWAGARVVSGDADGQVRAWQPDTGVTWVWQPPAALGAAPGAVRAIAANPAGTHVAVGFAKGGAAVFSPDKGAAVGAPPLAKIGVRAADFDTQGRLWLLDVDTNLRRTTYKGGAWALDWTAAGPKDAPGAPQAVIARGGKALVLAGAGGVGVLSHQGAFAPWTLGLGGAPAGLDASAGVWALSDTAGALALGSASDGAWGWTGAPHGGKAVGSPALVRTPAGARHLATSGADAFTRAAAVATPAAPKTWSLSPLGAWGGVGGQVPTATSALAWSPDAATLYRAVGPRIQGLAALGPQQGKEVYAVLLAKGVVVDALAVAPANQRLAVSTQGTTTHLRVLSLATGKTLWSRQGLGAQQRAMAWRPDGSELMVSGGKAHLQLISAKDGATLLQLYGHLSPVRSIAWSSDGSRMLSASADGAIRLWRRTAAGVLGEATLVRHCDWPCFSEGGVVAARFASPDGTHWVSVGADGGLIGWASP